ncbi:late competence protein ComEA, DNA receptor [Hydrogenimonas sp.]|nr:late competence protein ComEA, DNA receptor [Hydrogenimonas sp.]
MKLFLITAVSAATLFAAVDINSATAKELQSVKGIGEKKAKQIVAFREKNCFQSLRDLTKIKGIGEKTLKKLTPQLEVGPCRKK